MRRLSCGGFAAKTHSSLQVIMSTKTLDTILSNLTGV